MVIKGDPWLSCSHLSLSLSFCLCNHFYRLYCSIQATWLSLYFTITRTETHETSAIARLRLIEKLIAVKEKDEEDGNFAAPSCVLIDSQVRLISYGSVSHDMETNSPARESHLSHSLNGLIQLIYQQKFKSQKWLHVFVLRMNGWLCRVTLANHMRPIMWTSGFLPFLFFSSCHCSHQFVLLLYTSFTLFNLQFTISHLIRHYLNGSLFISFSHSTSFSSLDSLHVSMWTFRFHWSNQLKEWADRHPSTCKDVFSLTKNTFSKVTKTHFFRPVPRTRWKRQKNRSCEIMDECHSFSLSPLSLSSNFVNWREGKIWKEKVRKEWVHCEMLSC